MTKNTKNTDSLSSIVEKAVKAAGKSASKAIDKAVDKAVDEAVKIADTPKAKEVKKSVQKVADEAKSTAADIKEGAKMIKEDTKEAAKTASTEAKAAVKAVRTKVSDVVLEGEEVNVSVSDIEKEVKKDALEKGLKGDIKIYLNINEKAAYYTVDGEGASEYKIDLTVLG